MSKLIERTKRNETEQNRREKSGEEREGNVRKQVELLEDVNIEKLTLVIRQGTLSVPFSPPSPARPPPPLLLLPPLLLPLPLGHQPVGLNFDRDNFSPLNNFAPSAAVAKIFIVFPSSASSGSPPASLLPYSPTLLLHVC